MKRKKGNVIVKAGQKHIRYGSNQTEQKTLKYDNKCLIKDHKYEAITFLIRSLDLWYVIQALQDHHNQNKTIIAYI